MGMTVFAAARSIAPAMAAEINGRRRFQQGSVRPYGWVFE